MKALYSKSYLYHNVDMLHVRVFMYDGYRLFVHELRRLLGMVNQLGKSSPNLAQLTQPLRQLLSKRSTWLWGPEQEQAFCKIKDELTKPTVLALYNPQAPTRVSADASSYGLGAVVLQENNEGEWRPIAYASRLLTETESRYVQIEKEALAVTWACEKFSMYILGMRFQTETDHKPLLGSKQLDRLPPQVLRFRLRLARYDYDIQHVPGKLLYTADTLSRSPIQTTANHPELEQDAETFVDACVANLPATSGRLKQIQEAQEEDRTCKEVITHTEKGWPKKGTLDPDLIPFWQARANLTVDRNNLLLHGNRVVIPKRLQQETLHKIH